jgi:hypothetical protein
MADDDRASHGSRHSGSGQLDGALPLLQVTGAGAGEVNGQYDCVQLDLGRLGTVQRNAVYRKKDDPDIMIVLFRYRPSVSRLRPACSPHHLPAVPGCLAIRPPADCIMGDRH